MPITSTTEANNLGALSSTEWRIVARQAMGASALEWIYTIPLGEMSTFHLARNSGAVVTVQQREGTVTTLFAKLPKLGGPVRRGRR